jgi:hypothetical protein
VVSEPGDAATVPVLSALDEGCEATDAGSEEALTVPGMPGRLDVAEAEEMELLSRLPDASCNVLEAGLVSLLVASVVELDTDSGTDAPWPRSCENDAITVA